VARPNSVKEATEMLEDVKQWANANDGADFEGSEDEMNDLADTAEEANEAVSTLYGEWEDAKNDDPEENSGDPDEDDEDEDEEP
jgi:hypothetical protein